jgi:hypothetical protein
MIGGTDKCNARSSEISSENSAPDLPLVADIAIGRVIDVFRKCGR